MAKGDDIQERLINFAVTIIQLCASLPQTQAGKHVVPDNCCVAEHHQRRIMEKLVVLRVVMTLSINLELC